MCEDVIVTLFGPFAAGYILAEDDGLAGLEPGAFWTDLDNFGAGYFCTWAAYRKPGRKLFMDNLVCANICGNYLFPVREAAQQYRVTKKSVNSGFEVHGSEDLFLDDIFSQQQKHFRFN